MTEVAYLPQIECVITKEDALFNTQIVYVADEVGNQQFLRVGKGALQREGEKTYLPIGVVDLDAAKQRVLVELPQEADSGARRLWVRLSSFRPQRAAS